MIAVRQYEAGEVIFFENDIGETAYIIERGRVEVLKNLDGNNVHIAYIGPGEPFGEMSVIDEKPRSATVVAVERTFVRELHRDEFLQDIQTHPEIAISLLKVLFERLREADTTILRLHKSQPVDQLDIVQELQSSIFPSARRGNVARLQTDPGSRSA